MEIIWIILIIVASALTIWFIWGIISPHIWEQPEFEVLERLQKVEIRKYSQSRILTTKASTSSNAFSKLSSYIFGKNKEKTKIAMTAPVLTQAAENENVRMVFYLPKNYKNKDTPTPFMDDIKTEVQDERKVAIMRFYGRISEKKREKYIEKLLDTLKDRNIQTKGSLFYLNYSDPFVPPPLRRNEIGIEITP